MAAPWCAAATSNAARVRVEVFSKISAITRPASRCRSIPAARSAFSSRRQIDQSVELAAR